MNDRNVIKSINMLYLFLRVFFIPVLLFGYLLFQFTIKKKKFIELKNDLFFVIVFSAMIFLLYFLLQKRENPS